MRRSPRAWLYLLGRAECLGLPLLRWVVIVAVVAALAALLGLRQAGVAVAVLLLLMAGALIVLHALLRRRDFVVFSRSTSPGLDDDATIRLAPNDKIPVYLTGALAVNARVRRFTLLPGFYRTFANREHVLIGQCRERNVLAIASWPERELGLWYAFVHPEAIHDIRRGMLKCDARQLPAIAVDYTAEWAAQRGTQRRAELLFIAAPSENDLNRIVADLTMERGAHVSTAASTS